MSRSWSPVPIHTPHCRHVRCGVWPNRVSLRPASIRYQEALPWKSRSTLCLAWWKAAGAVHLDTGLYELELLIAKGKGTLEVRRPDDVTFAPAVMGDLLRAAKAEAMPRSDCLVAALDFETLDKETTPVSGNQRAKTTVEGGSLVDGRQGDRLAEGPCSHRRSA